MPGALFDLTDKVALVTGATGGIGSAICDVLAQYGADIVAHHLADSAGAATLASTCRAHGAQFLDVEGDLRRTSTIDDVVSTAFDWQGRLDIVVNNAGILIEAPVEAITDEAWNDVLSVNLTAPFALARKAASRMTSGDGAIVNISSRVAYTGGPGLAAYAASKAGLGGLTRALAWELGPDIRVNAVAPGPIDTALVSEVNDAQWMERKTRGLVTKTLGTPQDVAPAVLFLSSPASRLFHGQTLHPNGGGVMP
jgi:3-oxoacyl-[acyl-carrier protein] reductase